MVYIDKYMQHKLFNLEDLADKFDLKEKKTKLRKYIPADIISKKEPTVQTNTVAGVHPDSTP